VRKHNFSWKILAFTVADRLEPAVTSEVLLSGSRHLDAGGRPPTVVAGSAGWRT